MSAYSSAVAHAHAALLADRELVAAVGGRIYEGIAPQSATYPLVVVQAYGDPEDTRGQNGRVLTVLELTVRAWSRTPESRHGSLAGLIVPAARIDAVLDNTGPIVVQGATVAAFSRIAEMTSTETREGAVVRSMGSRFRVTVGALPA